MNIQAKKKIWVVDDDNSIRWVLCRTLRSEGFEVRDFVHAEAAISALMRDQPDVLMTDIRMPGKSGLELSKLVHKKFPSLPCIVMTAHTDLDSAVASYDSGAFEYLPKPFDLDEAVRFVQRAIDLNSTGFAEPSLDEGEIEIIGEAPAMQEVFRAIGRLAKSNINVLISGESGTGKELVAKALHRHSPRSIEPFIAINISAIPEDLVASELFGHEKGAFSGAIERRLGRFEQANGGTLFLDEVGEMTADLQTKLLRILSEQRFYRVGGSELVEIDVRILAASNQDLEQLVSQGKFREDLYHRLNVIRIDLPPLRERIEDLPLLAVRFLTESAKELDTEVKQLSDSALAKLVEFEWPGNVRQLENVCRWITVMAAANQVEKEDLPTEILEASAVVQSHDWESSLSMLVRQKLNRGQVNILEDLLKKFEAILLRNALDHTTGHRQNAAKLLGWGRNTLTRKLKDLDID